jgi:hypothetical protein
MTHVRLPRRAAGSRKIGTRISACVAAGMLLVAATTVSTISAAAAKPARPAANAAAFSFGVITHTSTRGGDDTLLRETIEATDADSLAFVVANGIKAPPEPCSDKLYFRRKELFQGAKNGLIVSIAAGDWSDCHLDNGRSVAIERLNRVRDLFFGEEFSFGGSRLPLMHQSATPKYRTYVENMRWEIGNMIFATVNLPFNNNGYLPAAGRNGEFEDRMVANRDWLHRLFGVASQKNAAGIVLFCDGDPLVAPDALTRIGFGYGRDGFEGIRAQIKALSARFRGRVLLVHGAETGTVAGNDTITWKDNLGAVGVAPGWLKVNVDPAAPALFSVGTAGGTKSAAQ